MALDKNKRNLIILVGLVIVGGGVAAWQFGLFKSDPPPAPPAPPPAPAVATPPAPGTGPAVPGQPAPVVVEQDLPIPEKVSIRVTTYKWPVDAPSNSSGWKPAEGEKYAYDPFMVQNIEVVDPDRAKYIDQIRQDWVPDGITETWQWVKELDEDGKPKLGPDGKPIEKWELVREAWFKGKRRPYRAGDRLTNTRFVIEAIILGDKYDANHITKAIIRLKGDTGAQLDLELAPASRYDDKGK
ncbi:MAG: hypothetical protein IT464_14370 [Planctomycetes bacterium]|nr:hypothetical protein [Planctomycetota bacterium]